ncbi:histidine phosphatase family protein [Streptococcus chenjunshii]|uniref:Histidine phosphatase family protein n=1 Tax=Streptococcus chenjunshii TaxID=2173853 RepID=A0A372KLI8_9STRE|nr:histidine phosphatase family protein [Streptococcus chenjunshii]AXQ79055.1 histidine phosphatase family protein [Streptococcus chenjunshii]RFU51251.1 histidine phosphatase family protein [Streptococcus chenjunshii]RFU53133.1 histidine phosphatase family protein [Streptococcus chenjunshii]
MKLYFVRHGKTQWNLEGRFQGAGGDSPLLEETIEEIETLGRYLSHIPFDAVYSSDLRRAKETGRIINKQNKNPKIIQYTPALREWRLGKLEGSKISTMTSIYPQQMKAFRHNLAKFNASMFEAESVYQTTQRVRELIASLRHKSFENVLFIGHGANLTASIQSLLGFAPANLRRLGGLDNLSLTVLETSDFEQYNCLLWNDKSYLTEVQEEVQQNL